jgi:hypothetical protein
LSSKQGGDGNAGKVVNGVQGKEKGEVQAKAFKPINHGNREF